MKLSLSSKRERWVLACCIMVFAIPLLSWTKRAPFHDVYGDVYRGWPLSYGLDQGDVTGEYLFRLAYFSWPRFLADLAVATLAGSTLYSMYYGARKIAAKHRNLG